MNNRIPRHVIGAAIILCASLASHALDANHFAQSSRLAQGHWVKVAITQTGMYEIDRAQLAEMGFSDPSQVRIYGYGGKMLSEVLTNTLPDDLQQIPALHQSDKVCFYGVGNVSMTLKNTSSYPTFSRERNTYSLQGHYFLTDNSSDPLLEATSMPFLSSASRAVSTSYDYYLHEQEQRSLSFTGSELLGEDITQGKRTFDFQLLNASSETTYLTTRIASKIVRASAGDNSSVVQGQFHCYLTCNGTTTEVPYTAVSGYIKGATRDYTFYESGEGTEIATVASSDGRGSLRYQVVENTGKGVMQVALLDYFIMTYQHHNTLIGQPTAQCLLGYVSSTSDDKVVIKGGASHVWDITQPDNPCTMEVQTGDDGNVCFTPGIQSTPHQYIAFDPTSTLLKIDSYQAIENQNLHALAVPDMLIITTKTLFDQGERIAQLHRQHDGMDVTVVDHEQIYNEFSSGTPSAMAYRLMCKMFHDRDRQKFKSLLLLGQSSFDNRGIVSGKKDRLMCYETALSNYDDNSHVIEDFFGYLDDNSGRVIPADTLQIAVGRIPSSSWVEAKSDVDKLYEYVLSPDYGVWRNNYCMWAEKSSVQEDKLHEKQADGIGYILENSLDIKMMPDRAFVGMFPQDVSESFKDEDKRASTEGRKHIQEMLNEGQYFATYVGHAGPNSYTHSGLWRTMDVATNNYSNWPIMTTACCDVARFDSDHQGIAEQMFHKRNGGAIALFTTARQVYANSNDYLNRAFTHAMFSYDTRGRMPTLGEVYVDTKRSYHRISNSNKLNYLLLGDPAIKINYPKGLFNVTKLNTTTLNASNTVTVRPLQKLTIEAKVMREDDPSQVNTAFNGDATISIYDIKRSFMTVEGTGDYEGETHTVYYPQELITRVTGRVVSGVFTGSVVIPRYQRAKNAKCTISVYAHEDGTDQMVNGKTDQLIIGTYTGTNIVQDSQSPIIEQMYLNDAESFATNFQTGSDAMLYLRATDDMGFNIQQQAMGQGMTLRLDSGKKTYNLVKNHATLSDEGRTLDIAMPLNGLTAGRHTLDFTVADVCGNRTSHSISFVVASSNDITLAATERSSWENAEIDLTAFTLNEVPDVNVKVTDLKGNLVWSQTTNSFPLTWDLTDMSGNRVKPGLYKIHGNYESPEGYGGTNIVNFVVLNPL